MYYLSFTGLITGYLIAKKTINECRGKSDLIKIGVIVLIPLSLLSPLFLFILMHLISSYYVVVNDNQSKG